MENEKIDENKKISEYTKMYEEGQIKIAELKNENYQIESQSKVFSNEIDGIDNEIKDLNRKIKD